MHLLLHFAEMSRIFDEAGINNRIIKIGYFLKHADLNLLEVFIKDCGLELGEHPLLVLRGQKTVCGFVFESPIRRINICFIDSQ